MATKASPVTLADQVEGARIYLEQAAERVAGLAPADPPGRGDLTMIEVARDEARQAAKLMQRVHERATRAAAREAQEAAQAGA